MDFVDTIEDLDIADDIALLSHKQQQMQAKTDQWQRLQEVLDYALTKEKLKF